LKAVPHLLPTWLKKFGKVPSESGYSEKGLGQQLKNPANPKKKNTAAAATEPREEMEEEQQAATESGQKQQQKQQQQQQQQERSSNLSPQKLRAAKFYANLYTKSRHVETQKWAKFPPIFYIPFANFWKKIIIHFVHVKTDPFAMVHCIIQF
jgi:hypothetical protein